MKRLIFVGVMCAAIGVMTVREALAITQAQSYIVAVFEELKMKLVETKVDGKLVIGGNQRFKVTKETLELLKKAMADGKEIVIDGEGKVTIEKP